MNLKRYTLDGTVDLVKKAIERIKSCEEYAKLNNDEGYYVAYSGGKDSDVIRILCELAGVKYQLYHNHTTVDAPETVYYVRSIPNIKYNYPKTSMWKLIVKTGFPPSRRKRYCCSELKERGGVGRWIMTGVRRFESQKRSNSGVVETWHKDKTKRKVFTDDNTENRLMLENCILKGKVMLNPIVDWYDEDVWEFLNYYGCQSNPLYKCGFDRVGCVGCPLASIHKKKREFIHYPKYKELYIKTFDKMLKDGRERILKSGEEVFDAWLSEEYNTLPDENQFTIFDDDDD
jgi:phosphoadenosine phosphosulfate reductase